MAAHVLAKPLINILNLSIKTNHFPTQWKTGQVTPIHKSGNRSHQNNFRPITILCTLSKSLEQHVHDSLYNFLIKNSSLYLAQSGFQALHSCETALNNLVDMWTSNMEKGLPNIIIFLYLRKSFDLLDIDILLKSLSVYQFDKNTIDWLKSYLQTREQCVQFKGKISDTKPVTHGVPQGSILGPLLFIVFMNDLPLHVDSSLDMYADDSTLGASGKTIEDSEVKLNSDMVKVNTWCKHNKMAINCDKTKVMLITTYQKEAKLDSTHVSVRCDSTELENVNSNILLSAIIDNQPHLEISY